MITLFTRFSRNFCMAASIVALLALPSGTAWSAPIDQAAADKFSFESIGVSDLTLTGPLDVARFEFSVPSYWELVEGGELELDYSVVTSAALAAPEDGQAAEVPILGNLQLFLNEEALGSVPIDRAGVGQRGFVSISPDALAREGSAGVHQLQLVFQPVQSCDLAAQTSVTVHKTSLLDLAHVPVAPSTDLRHLPHPIYSPHAILPVKASIVVPDESSQADIQAALTVAAAFGRMSEGELELTLRPESLLSAEERASNHLIFVGPFGAPGSHTVSVGPEDGILQMAVSPWNNERVLLIVSGESEAGIVKAARAISSGIIQTSASPEIAVVADASTAAPVASVPVTRTLAELGYGSITLDEVGGNQREVVFYIPAGRVAAGEAFLDLVFSHAPTLDYDTSELLLAVNGERLGTVPLGVDTAQQGLARLSVPASALRPGFNSLALQAELWPADPCIGLQDGDIWLTLRSESMMNIPVAPDVRSLLQQPDFDVYPDSFAGNPALSDTAFLIPPADPEAWALAAQIAFDLGARAGSRGTAVGLTAGFDGEASLESFYSANLIIVGRPSALQAVTDMTDELPVPFEPGTDQASERAGVVYRLPPDASVGYLEVLAWPKDHVALAVLGTDAAGLAQAGAVLTDQLLREQLEGNFAILSADQVFSVQVEAEPAAGAAGASDGAGGGGRPEWITPLLAASSALMALVILVVLVGYARRARANR